MVPNTGWSLAILCLVILSPGTWTQKPCDIYTEQWECPGQQLKVPWGIQLRDFEGQYKCKDNPMEATLELMEEGEKQMELSPNEEAVMIIGRTGTGKSTLTYFIAGNNSQMIAYKKGTGNYLIKDCQGAISSGDNTIVSATIFPDLVIETQTNTAYYDNPGFQDTRDVCTEISNAYFIQVIARHVKKLKFVLAIDSASIKASGDRLAFPELLKSVISFVPGIEKFGAGLALIGTKLKFDVGEDIEDPYIEDAVTFLQDNRNGLSGHFPDPDDLRKAQFVVDTLIASPFPVSSGRIAMFRTPTDCGLMSDLENMQDNKKNITQVISNNLEFVSSSVDDFGYSLSDTAKVTIADVSKKLNQDIVLMISSFAQELYHYIEYQLVCTSLRSCDNLVQDLQTLFSNPDFSNKFSDTTFWLSLPFKSAVHRILDPQFLPTDFSPSVSQETLEKNAGYLDFLASITTVDNLVDLWLQPLRDLITNLTQKISQISIDIEKSNLGIVNDLRGDFQTVFNQSLQNLVEGKLDDSTAFERVVSSLYKASYNLSGDSKPSDFAQEIVDNIQTFKEGFSNGSHVDSELLALKSFSLNLDTLLKLDVEMSVSLNPSSWRDPLVSLNNTVFLAIKGQIALLNDHMKSLIFDLYIRTEDHCRHLNDLGSGEIVYTILDQARRQFDILNGFQSSISLTQQRIGFLNDLKSKYEEINNIMIIQGCQDFIREAIVFNGRVAVLERLNLGRTELLQAEWILQVRVSTTSVLDPIVQFARETVGVFVQNGANNVAAKLSSNIRSTYQDIGTSFSKQRLLAVDEQKVKLLIEQMTKCFNSATSTLKCFSANNFEVLTQLTAKIEAGDLQRLPVDTLQVDFNDLGHLPYKLKEWVNTYNITLQVFDEVKKPLSSVARSTIYSPRATTWGYWGSWERCPPGTFVGGMQLKTESYQTGWGDDTSLNAIRFFCSVIDKPNNEVQARITSKQGDSGGWGNEYYCSGSFKAVGFQLRSEYDQGGLHDDSAGQNLRLLCENGEVHEGDGLWFGSWTATQYCPSGKVMCEIQTQVDDDDGGGGTGLNNIDSKCCNLLN